jgi:hypothetical protein
LAPQWGLAFWLNSREIVMPMVGGKKYGYDAKGKAEAKKAAAKTGKPVKMAPHKGKKK